jgi:hypothetical protein
LIRAGIQHAFHGVEFGFSYPYKVFDLDGNLAGYIAAAVRFMRQPVGGVLAAFLLIGRTVRRKQV